MSRPCSPKITAKKADMILTSLRTTTDDALRIAERFNVSAATVTKMAWANGLSMVGRSR